MRPPLNSMAASAGGGNGRSILPQPFGRVTRPVVHRDTPALEQVRAGIGRLHVVPDHIRQGRLNHLPGMIRLRPFGNSAHGPVPRRPGDESEQETGSPNDPGMIDGFLLWASGRCRQMGRHPSDRMAVWHGGDPATHNAFLSEGEATRRCGGGCRLAEPASSLESTPSGARARLTAVRTTAPWPCSPRAGSRHANPGAAMERATAMESAAPAGNPPRLRSGSHNFPQSGRRG